MMESLKALLAKSPSKLKMVECKLVLGCSEAEWLEIGAILLEITKEFELSTISWSDHKYEEAAEAAFTRIPILKPHLARLDKDDRYQYEVVKRMITVKAKKQTELEMKRRHRSGVSVEKKPVAQRETMEIISTDSRSASPADPSSPKSSPVSAYAYEYRRSDEPVVPRPYQHGRGVPILSPVSAQSNPAEISDIFLAQTHQYVSSFRNLQETLRRREGEIYGLQSKVIELERQLEGYRRSEVQRNGVDSQKRVSRR